MGTDRDRTPWSLAIAAQVRAERSACGWTQAEAVRRVKRYMGRSTYLRLESGERVADVSQIAQVCDVFGIDFMTLVARAEERVPDFERQLNVVEMPKPPTADEFGLAAKKGERETPFDSQE